MADEVEHLKRLREGERHWAGAGARAVPAEVPRAVVARAGRVHARIIDLGGETEKNQQQINRLLILTFALIFFTTKTLALDDDDDWGDPWFTSNSLMLLDVTNRPMPMGMKMRPMTKKAGSTVPAVRMGCHAGSRCCLNAVLSGFLLLTAPAPPPLPGAPEWCPSSSLAL